MVGYMWSTATTVLTGELVLAVVALVKVIAVDDRATGKVNAMLWDGGGRLGMRGRTGWRQWGRH